jgi:hypothetical protein
MTSKKGKIGSSGPRRADAAAAGKAAKEPAKQDRRNLRWVRVLKAFEERKYHSREQLDRIAGASNSPDLMMRLRRTLGIEFICERVLTIDRDDLLCTSGMYSLTPAGSRRARAWLAKVMVPITATPADLATPLS